MMSYKGLERIMKHSKHTVNAAVKKRVLKSTQKKKPVTSPGHKQRFNQLLDDAVLGVTSSTKR